MIAGRLPVTIDLLYGRSTLPVSPPAGCMPTVIEKRAMPVLAEPLAAVARALAEPVGSPALREQARGKRSACILICDITRPVPNGLFLPALIRTLLDAGVPRAGITVLVATGLHRPNEGRELAELVGDPWTLETVTVANHDARADEDHVLLGRTPGAAPWCASIAASSRPSSASRPAWWNRTSWPAGRAGARSSRPASRTPRPSPRSTTRPSWRTRARPTACSTAIRCTRSSSRSWRCWAARSRSTP